MQIFLSPFEPPKVRRFNDASIISSNRNGFSVRQVSFLAASGLRDERFGSILLALPTYTLVGVGNTGWASESYKERDRKHHHNCLHLRALAA